MVVIGEVPRESLSVQYVSLGADGSVACQLISS